VGNPSKIPLETSPAGPSHQFSTLPDLGLSGFLLWFDFVNMTQRYYQLATQGGGENPLRGTSK